MSHGLLAIEVRLLGGAMTLGGPTRTALLASVAVAAFVGLWSSAQGEPMPHARSDGSGVVADWSQLTPYLLDRLAGASVEPQPPELSRQSFAIRWKQRSLILSISVSPVRAAEHYGEWHAANLGGTEVSPPRGDQEIQVDDTPALLWRYKNVEATLRPEEPSREPGVIREDRALLRRIAEPVQAFFKRHTVPDLHSFVPRLVLAQTVPPQWRLGSALPLAIRVTGIDPADARFELSPASGLTAPIELVSATLAGIVLMPRRVGQVTAQLEVANRRTLLATAVRFDGLVLQGTGATPRTALARPLLGHRIAGTATISVLAVPAARLEPEFEVIYLLELDESRFVLVELAGPRFTNAPLPLVIRLRRAFYVERNRPPRLLNLADFNLVMGQTEAHLSGHFALNEETWTVTPAPEVLQLLPAPKAPRIATPEDLDLQKRLAPITESKVLRRLREAGLMAAH